jgi:hypothetical protein
MAGGDTHGANRQESHYEQHYPVYSISAGSADDSLLTQGDAFLDNRR